MSVKQLSIFVENKPGRLAYITKTLADASIDIRALSVADTCDFGILRLIVDDTKKATRTLEQSGVTVTVTDVLAICIDDAPGGFSKAISVLAGAGIGVEYLYAFIGREIGKAYVILRVDNEEQAAAALKADGIVMLETSDIQAM